MTVVSSSQFPLSPSSRRNLERALTELRAWRHVARADLRDELDPARRPVLRQRVTDLDTLCQKLEQLLHPASHAPNGDTQP